MGIQDAGVAEAHVPLVDSGVNAVICSRRTGRLRVSDRIDGIGPAIARLLHAALRVPRMCDRSAEIIELPPYRGIRPEGGGSGTSERNSTVVIGAQSGADRNGLSGF